MIQNRKIFTAGLILVLLLLACSCIPLSATAMTKADLINAVLSKKDAEIPEP